MSDPKANPEAVDGDPVPAKNMAAALTRGTLVFGDGATQVFTPDGRTTYVDHGRPTVGEWSIVGDGMFSSYWPPDYRATYSLGWIVEEKGVVGLSFTDVSRGERFDGRYQ